MKRGGWRVAWAVGTVGLLALPSCTLLLGSDLTGGQGNPDRGGAGEGGLITLPDGAVVEAGSDGGVNVAPPPSVVPPAPGCVGRTFTKPSLSAHIDDLEHGFGSDWNVYGSTCIVASGTGFTATPAANVEDMFCTAYTAATYHLTCDSLTVKVSEATQSKVGAQTYIYISTQQGLITLIKESAGFSLVPPIDAGAGVALGSYTPGTDVWWRLREDGGHLYFATSPDGMTWNERGSLVTSVPVDDVSIGLGAGVYKAVDVPGQAQFSCLNAPCP